MHSTIKPAQNEGNPSFFYGVVDRIRLQLPQLEYLDIATR